MIPRAIPSPNDRKHAKFPSDSSFQGLHLPPSTLSPFAPCAPMVVVSPTSDLPSYPMLSRSQSSSIECRNKLGSSPSLMSPTLVSPSGSPNFRSAQNMHNRLMINNYNQQISRGQTPEPPSMSELMMQDQQEQLRRVLAVSVEKGIITEDQMNKMLGL